MGKKCVKQKSAKQCIITVSDISKQNAYLSINIDYLIWKLKTKYVYKHKIAFGKTCVTRKNQWVGFEKRQQFSSCMGWHQYANTVRCFTCL